MTWPGPALLSLLAALTLDGAGASAASKPPSADEAAAPKAFLVQLYARYGERVHSAVDYLEPPEDRLTFEPGLVAMMHRLEARHADDALGPLDDADILCQCQDFTDIRAQVAVVAVEAGRARAVVTVADRGQRPTRLRFTLVRTAAGWRIWDLTDPTGWSLRRMVRSDLEPKSAPPNEPARRPARPRRDG
jgi:hypothetical protein